MKKLLLLILVFLLLLPGCGKQAEEGSAAEEADSPALEGGGPLVLPNTRESTDVRLTVSAFGEDPETFMLDMCFENVGEEIAYVFERIWHFEKKVEGEWVALSHPTGEIFLDSVRLSVSPGEKFFFRCFPKDWAKSFGEPGEYRITTRLYEARWPEPEGDDLIRVSAEFVYPGRALEWVDGTFEDTEAYLPMEVELEKNEVTSGQYMNIRFPLESERKGDPRLVMGCVYHLQRKEGDIWKTAPYFKSGPYFEDALLGSQYEFDGPYGGECSVKYGLSPVYGLLERGVQYRLILEVTTFYDSDRDTQEVLIYADEFTAA